MIAGMDIRDEAFQAISNKFDRAAEKLGQRDRRHLIRVGMHLDAERAADVLGQHPHLVLLETEVLGKQVLHHVRRLRALIDRETLLARVPIGHDRARLVGHAGVAAEAERGFDDRIGLRKSLIRRTGFVLALEGEIVAQLRMDHLRRRIERGLGIRDRCQLFVGDFDQLARILGQRAGARHHGANRFALPARAVDRDRILRRRLDPFQVREHANPWGHDFGELGAGHHCDDAIRLLGRRGLDVADACMRMRRAYEGDMHHARQRDVADILGSSLGQARKVGPRHRAADVGVRPVEGGHDWRDIRRYFHRVCPWRAKATASTASTIA